jgi:hypothetical protein
MNMCTVHCTLQYVYLYDKEIIYNKIIGMDYTV